MNPVLLLARACVLETRRGALPWLAAGLVVAALGLAAFLAQVALTETRELQAAFAAALLRAGGAFLLATHIAAGIVRESNDKVQELALALPISRGQYFVGKLCGFTAVGAALSAAFAAPMLLWAAPGAVAAWGVSLAFELLLVAAASLFFALALVSVVPALAATFGLYLLARAIAAIQLLARGSLAEETWTQALARYSVDGVALLLPRLDAVTRSDWLLYGAPGAAEFGAALGALALYSVLLVAAGLFDFYRRNL
jgi:hypothetical protein